MKRLIIAPLLFFLASCSTAPEGVNKQAHKTCLKAADYVGCIETFNNFDPSKKLSSKQEQQLLNEIKKLPGRMNNTSLRDFSENVRDFVDALSIAKFDNPTSEVVINSEKLKASFDVLYETWQRKIECDGKSYFDGTYMGKKYEYGCWDWKTSIAAKNKLDTLFQSNTFEIRCRSGSLFNKEFSDSIFLPVFKTIELAATKLAKDGEIDFKNSKEEPLIPLIEKTPTSLAFIRKCKHEKAQKSSKLPIQCKQGTWKKTDKRCQPPENLITSPADMD